ncbi:MAG: ABC-type transport auxiliary lipoprotein family protein [Pseudomonas sp.]|uniref:ABC-type transport auxiliary lipoprotein family protein n=1 Tax=Pseudomonas abieticivorans TaxID=2931382 RepID=UPI0020BE6FD4|nr:ABC-type transport auxiliary lipoprotein family protein [Pseudomonas sp. PIA16]MDE1167544.1 ABC-type transport auxiliary lipoprotein family protein [Pseudomonas sp.]
MKPILLPLVASLGLLSACSILPQAEPADVYRLPAAAAPARNANAVPWSLRIAKPEASGALNTPRIAVIPQGDVISSYKGARWSDPAPVLLRNRLLDAFAQDGRVQRLSSDDANLYGDFELGGQLQAFQTEYAASGPQAVIRFDALLVSSTHRILASRRFEVHQPLNDPKVPSVVAGFGQASDQLIKQVIDWTVAQAGQQYQPKNQ